MFQLLFLRPALGVEGEFDAVGSDYDGAYFRFGAVTYDVEKLSTLENY